MMRLLRIFFLCLFPACVSAQDSLNVHFVGHFPFASQLADVQGYVAPNGAEYAIVTKQDGVSIVSLANPSQPFLLHDIPGDPTINREVETFGQYAYVTAEATQGLRIIDLSGLPGSIAYKDTIIDTISRSHSLYISDSVLYLFASTTNHGATLYSLADPWNPVRLGAYRDELVHDGYVRGHLGYLCEPGPGQLKVIDFHQPAQPQVLGAITTPSGGTHNSWLSNDGNTCFVAEEQYGAPVTAYDVSDPANIVELDRIYPSYAMPLSIPHNVKVKDDWLVTAHYTEGLHIVDADRPHNLVEVGYYDHSLIAPGSFSGSWGADPYLPSGLVLSGDMENGLFIFQVDYMRACYLEGLVTDAQTGLPINGASVSLLSTPWATQANASGAYAFGTAVAGTYQVLYRHPGYRDSLITLTLGNGVLSLVNMPLEPTSPILLEIDVRESGTNLPLAGAGFTFIRLPDSAIYTFYADANGQLNTQQLVQADYSLYAGHWGHTTVDLGASGYWRDTSFTIHLDAGYEDPFAVDLGWVATGTATSGDWVREAPVGTYSSTNTPCNPSRDLPNDIGNQCYVSGNGGGGMQDDDIDNGFVVLTSPSMDLSRHDQPWLHLSTWFCSRGISSAFGGDTLWLEIDNGTSTASLRQQTNHAAFWRRDSFLLSSFIPLSADMRLIIRAKEAAFDRIVETAVDGFRVSGTPLADVPARGVAATVRLDVFPNPSSGPATVSYDLGSARRLPGASFEVHDLAGRLLHAQPLGGMAGAFQLVLDLPAGMYVGSIRSGEGVLRSVRIVR